MNVSSRIGKQQDAQVQNWKEKAARGAGTMFQEFVLNILEKCDEKYNEDMGNAEVKMKILADVIKEQNRKIAELEATVHGHRTQAPVKGVRPPTTVSANSGIGQTQLSAFYGQDENAGMFLNEHTRYISHGGKKYDERVALAECNLHVAGRRWVRNLSWKAQHTRNTLKMEW
jgi:hypothetical protein